MVTIFSGHHFFYPLILKLFVLLFFKKDIEKDMKMFIFWWNMWSIVRHGEYSEYSLVYFLMKHGDKRWDWWLILTGHHFLSSIFWWKAWWSRVKIWSRIKVVRHGDKFLVYYLFLTSHHFYPLIFWWSMMTIF